MVAIRRLGLAGGVLVAIVIGWSQVALTLAAPMPKVGVAYQTSGGAGIGSTTYTVVADMVLPAGKYHVTARGTVNNQTGAAVDFVACNAYGGSTFVDGGSASAPLQYAGFGIDGTLDLPVGGTLRVECISGVSGPTVPFVTVSLGAESVAGISVLP
jgi:hypothetical protein